MGDPRLPLAAGAAGGRPTGRQQGPPLALAARLGFELPDTLVTNDPDAFLAFRRRGGPGLVSKSLAPFELVLEGQDHVVSYVRAVSRDVAGFRSVRHGPVIFQDCVPKQFEVRVTIVGRRVFATQIASQASRAARDDWRHVDDESVGYSPYALPERIPRCLHLMDALGLSYGAVDLIVTPDGRHVFLEINPNGQWGWIEDLTGQPISDAVADVLAGRAVDAAA